MELEHKHKKRKFHYDKVSFQKIGVDTSDEVIMNEINELEKIDYSVVETDNIKKLSYHTYGYIETFKTISDSLHMLKRKQFILGLLAGIWIGFAYTAVVFATYHFDNSSVVKLLTGLVFSGVLLMITFLGGGFVTAYFWYNRTMFKRVESVRNFMNSCLFVYAGNIAGTGLFIWLMFLSRGFGLGSDLMMAKLYYNFGTGKMYGVGNFLARNVGLSGLSAGTVFKTIAFTFVSAIICTFLITYATQGAKSTKGNTVGSMIMYLVILFYFAIGGYQHCVANWYGAWAMICMAIQNSFMAFDWSNIDFYLTNAEGQPQAIIFNANIAWLYILLNIIPALLANFLGALLMGMFMGILNKEWDTVLIKRARLYYLKEIMEIRDFKNMKSSNREEMITNIKQNVNAEIKINRLKSKHIDVMKAERKKNPIDKKSPIVTKELDKIVKTKNTKKDK